MVRLFRPVILPIIEAFYLKRKAKENREKERVNSDDQYSVFDAQMERQNAMGQERSVDGKVPGGTGPLGYSINNPIPVKGTFGPVSYLARLRTLDGIKVEYQRLGSTWTVHIKYPIDIYLISYNNEEIGKLYFCGYFTDVSDKCPEGLSLLKWD